MKDGSQIKGTVVSATARSIELQTPDGLLSIASDRILRVDYSEKGGTAAAVPTPPPHAPGAYPPPYARPRPRTYSGASLVWPGARRQWFSLGFGFAVPLGQVDFSSAGGNKDDNGNSGFLISPQYLYGFAPRWGAGFELDYFSRSATHSQDLLPFSETRVSGNNLTLMPIVKYSLIEKGLARPYVLAGLGIHRSSTFIEARPDMGFVWSDTSSTEQRTLVDEAHWGLATTLRAGIDFATNSPGVFGVEFGWTHLESARYNPAPAGVDLGLAPLGGVQNVFATTFRWGWRF